MATIPTTIMFGSFECSLKHPTVTPAVLAEGKSSCTGSQAPVKVRAKKFSSVVKNNLQERSFYRPMHWWKAREAEHAARRARRNAEWDLATQRFMEERKFQAMGDSVVTSISVAGGPAPSAMENMTRKGLITTTPSMKKKTVFTKLFNTEKNWEKLMKELKRIVHSTDIKIELIGKRRITAHSKPFKGTRALYIETRHEKGLLQKVDLLTEHWMETIIMRLARTGRWQSRTVVETLKKGDSGLVLNASQLVGKFGRFRGGFFVVRGIYEGKLFDARSKVTRTTMLRMIHFSNAENFWRGLDGHWTEMRGTVDHACTADYSVYDCGRVAAYLTHSLLPCYKITCGKCAADFGSRTTEELHNLIYENATNGLTKVQKEAGNFMHVRKLLLTLANLAKPVHSLQKNFEEIFKMIGDRNTGPFKHINNLNEFFVRGKENSAKQWEMAHEDLLELARFQKNRTDNIKKGDLAAFRNKISSKANYNLYLSCDNQLDRNAGFVWGQREYHARRFFANFFEGIDPVKGYNSYQIRRNPVGTRKLAIGNLIVSLDLVNFRKQMHGEPVEQPPVGKQCISMKDGNFVYPCCCITMDDGSAATSTLYPPTKKHLVIGNSGDAKYVDLPKGDTDLLYITKEGYCYINIYLAMLVNVKEEDAKDFTKKVRDICVPKLGKWPTMLDLATTCAQLRIFYPDVHDAELPRILVDHEQQICHVVDSFGSIQTGYHILKASTVSQLVMFANDELESDIKHYRVGGITLNSAHSTIPERPLHTHQFLTKPFGMSEGKAILLLIKSIYKPEKMKELLLEEPYIMVMAIVSPGLLFAMYDNGIFDTAVKLWINEKQSIAMIASMLKSLSKKLTLAETLVGQLQIIESSAREIRDQMIDGTYPYLTQMSAINILQRLVDKASGDKDLIKGGFLNSESDIVHTIEKNYLDLLQEEWRELSWFGRLRATWRVRKLRRSFAAYSNPGKLLGMMEPCVILPTAALKGALVSTNNSIKSVRTTVSDYTNRKCADFSSFCLGRLIRRIPNAMSVLNTVVIISALLSVLASLQFMVLENRKHKRQMQNIEMEANDRACTEVYSVLATKLGKQPTWDEYDEYLKSVNPKLSDYINQFAKSDEVKHQDSKKDTKDMEAIIAFITLVLMMFDSERSDCVFRTLNKFKGVVGSLNAPVHHQSLDDYVEDFEKREHIIDFDVSDEKILQSSASEVTFEKWWNNQIERGNTIPHYRTEGTFMEFTRANAAKIASDICQSSDTDFLIRGAVGSGKSTGLPYHLSSTGRVLLIEPTRPLAENVHKQLSSAPFHLKPTMRMRGSSVFGSTPISVMTSGFALHFYANNVDQLADLDFIIFDECHVLDASAIAFRSLLNSYHKSCKILKVSATPPGREVEFTTQFPVKLIVEDTLSFTSFVSSLGSANNSDVLKYGKNILVYVASYNEVDSLSKLLTDKGMSVTKVDGRTMKHGNLEITTHGSAAKPHFVVATNIIENGVTLDIDVVVDFGMKVAPFLDIDNRSVAYNKVGVSFGERIQRLGRVGRFKPGAALKIGHTEKGLAEIPSMIATEAALYCFAYNLAVTTGGVSTSFISNCTVKQVRTMHQFELSPFFMYNFVAQDGTMHPVIHDQLKKYKLRDSITALSELSIPYRASSTWLQVRDYERIGVRIEASPDVKIAFHIRDVPTTLHAELWETICKYKSISMFPTIRSSSISKIAYTLNTDIQSIPRTLAYVDKIIEDERTKQAEFRSLLDNSCSSMFSIVGLTNTLRARYGKDFTGENIRKLEAIRSQLKEFQNIRNSQDESCLIKRYEALQYVHHQSESSLVKALKLKGIWSKSLVARDAIIAIFVAVGGAGMVWNWFKKEMSVVHHQGKQKSKRIQALKFRKARDKRMGYEIDNNEDTIEEYFGSAYTRKGKNKGTTVGMGKTSRRFISMYGFEPTEYSYIRFVDPLTGAQIEENIYADVLDIQEQFGEIRRQKILDDELDTLATHKNNTIHAYFMKDFGKKALKVDLTPHNPLQINLKSSGVSKFPEREAELRQTGKAVEVDVSEVPALEVEHEAKSFLKGPRDYNPIAQCICRLTAKTERGSTSTYGIGFGAYIITNHHLFRSFNGSMELQSHLGLFKVPNLKALLVKPIPGRDMILIRMPKDFPVFPQRLHFKGPLDSERVCIIGSLFQEKSISMTISETSPTYPVQRSTFWKHWIATDDGHCGLPVVSTADGTIIGIHSLANDKNSENYYSAFDEEFELTYLRCQEHMDWVKDWKYNPDKVIWGPLKLVESTPTGMFKTTKIIEDLHSGAFEAVREQGENTAWMLAALKDNLIAVNYMKSQLVTKHVVKGECIYFKQYLASNPTAKEFFEPLMWAYGASLLNKEAYIKDIMKYSKPIEVGVVHCNNFEEAVCRVILYMKMKGFRQCSFVTDEESIFKALNMKAAVGAMYGGKKKEYFDGYTQEDKERIIYESCLRLYSGKLGVWNGSLKAELRCKEKIQDNKTRTFTAAPIDTLLAGKVCVDDFNNQFYSHNIHCCWSVGMTKFYCGWDRLLRSLPDDWIYCDADGSQFDSSLTPYLINAVLSIRFAFMEEWEVGFQMLKNLYTEIVYTPISTPDGTIVKKFRGNNSGQPSTVVDNSLMVVLAMHYAFVQEKLSFEEVDSVCRFFVNGDDLLIGVRPDHEFLLDRFGSHFQELGLNYDFTSRTTNKEQLWFMSHRGIIVENTYIPKLEEERIVSILQWDRSNQPEMRLESICAAMIESWGYPTLIHEIRKFYQWMLNHEPFSSIADEGKAPYICSLALRRLYLNECVESYEIEEYMKFFAELDEDIDCNEGFVHHQAGQDEVLDAGGQAKRKNRAEREGENSQSEQSGNREGQDRDVNAGTSGTYSVPKIKAITSKMRLPKAKGKGVLNLNHLLEYTPDQVDISNTRATRTQFDTWYTAVQTTYDINDMEMSVLMNGLMVWCIENGTSPNINGVWTMMDGEAQIEYPLKPVVENAKPTLRQIMAHFSDVAEAYIEMRNKKEPYMPRYGLVRNLRDMNLARYAFDFYEINSRTPVRAREAHMQMKAAALKSAQTRLFGLDGGISTQEENTERHTTEDVSPNIHAMTGSRAF